MFPLKEGQGSTGLFRSSSVVVLLHAAVLLLLTRCCEGQSQVIGPPQPIITTIGEDVILPCHLEPAVDAVSVDVQWSRRDLMLGVVHVRRQGQDLLVDQNPTFEGRTSLLMDRLRVGDVSLKLSRVKLSDGGTYRCFIPGLDKDAAVQLVVGSVSSPAITDIYRSTDGVVLQCQSEGWYPEPEVSWLDGEDKHVSAVKTESVRGPDGLYTVSSRLTVEKRHSNNFTCRVQQKSINQTREIAIRISEDVSSGRTCSALLISVVLFAVLLLLTGLLLWICRQNKRRNKMNRQRKEEGEEEEEEELQFMTGRKEMKDVGEKKFMADMVPELENQKRELETLRYKEKTKVEEVEEQWKENEKRCQELQRTENWTTETLRSYFNTREKLGKEREEYNNSLRSVEEKLQETNETLREITEMKQKVEKQIEETKNLFIERKIQRDETPGVDQSQTFRGRSASDSGERSVTDSGGRSATYSRGRSATDLGVDQPHTPGADQPQIWG